jgi:predicted NAD/FAD-dependent oxidoreductase
VLSDGKVAVVGAGMAGVSCAVALQGHVGEVALFERASEPGGRMGRVPGVQLACDPGAQFLVVRHPLFRECVQAWHAGGLVREWGGWVVDLCRGDLTARDEVEPRYVGVPSMSALVQRLAEAVKPRCGRTVEEIERDADAWRLFDQRGEYLGRFDVVVIATAPAQALELLTVAPGLAELVAGVRMSAAWVAALQFEERLPLAFDAAYVHESPLHWIARDNSKPFRGERETWFLQASPEWSERHLIDLGERVLGALREAFAQATGLLELEPSAAQTYCWRQSVPVSPLDRDCLYDPGIGIGACGDWCAGPRVESAFISGFAMADRILRREAAGADG